MKYTKLGNLNTFWSRQQGTMHGLNHIILQYAPDYSQTMLN